MPDQRFPEDSEHGRDEGEGEQFHPPLLDADQDEQPVAEDAERSRMVEGVRPVNRYSQQELQRYRRDRAIDDRNDVAYYCLPTSFFALAEASGYRNLSFRPGTSGLSEYVNQIDDVAFDPDNGWSRAALSSQMRFLFDQMPVISWQTGRNTDESLEAMNLAAMLEAGYLKTPEEVQFFRDEIVNRDVSEIINSGLPVMVTVKPGFGKNRALHAVILDSWDEKNVHVVDPDQRSRRDTYSPERVREYMTGACTVIPPIDSDWITQWEYRHGRR
jgi:hypothetical protein